MRTCSAVCGLLLSEAAHAGALPAPRSVLAEAFFLLAFRLVAERCVDAVGVNSMIVAKDENWVLQV